MLVIGDGQRRVELSPGMRRDSEAAVAGAQRLATAAVDYAAGLAMLALHGISGRSPESEPTDRPGHNRQT